MDFVYIVIKHYLYKYGDGSFYVSIDSVWNSEVDAQKREVALRLELNEDDSILAFWTEYETYMVK